MRDERILYVPNESSPGQQVGPRAVLGQWVEAGRVRAVEVVPFDPNGREADAAALLAELRRMARSLRPTVVLWEHPSMIPLPTSGMERFRGAVSEAVVVYREGDAYGLLRKRMPIGSRRLAAICDMVFTPGLGDLRRLMRLRGAGVVGWAPSAVDTVRFGRPWQPTRDRRWDVVAIGSRHRARHPWGAMPGAERRAALVEALSAALGADRFAVFGTGWDGIPGARGPIAFADQETVSRQGRLTVSWDHFDRLPFFFSNRLPISLISGVPHLTNRHPGYGELFVDGRDLYLIDRVSDAVDRVHDILAQPQAALDGVGATAAALARRKLATDVVYRELLRSAVAWRDHRVRPPSPSAWWRRVSAREPDDGPAASDA